MTGVDAFRAKVTLLYPHDRLFGRSGGCSSRVDGLGFSHLSKTRANVSMAQLVSFLADIFSPVSTAVKSRQ